MNRFRELKQRLIKGKRDSQKVDISPSKELQFLPYQNMPIFFSTNYQLQQWVQNELQYYGISPSSYRLRQLKHQFNRQEGEAKPTQILRSKPSTQIYVQQTQFKNLLAQNIQQQQKISTQYPVTTKQQNKQLVQTKITRQQSGKQFSSSSVGTNRKLIQRNGHQNPQTQSSMEDWQKIIIKSFSKQHCSFQSSQNNESFLHRQNKKLVRKLQSQPNVASKIISKKDKNYHALSMNRLQSIKKTGTHQDELIEGSHLSYQENNGTSPVKQLDYYTLILQLTVELNYSRVNKESKNERSILKQLKNLICYIEGVSNLDSPLADSIGKSPLLLSNKKSCHTFSSIHSNASLMSQQNQDDFSDFSSNRRIELSKRQSQRFLTNQLSLTDNKFNSIEGHQSASNQDDQSVSNSEEHNQTFKSIDVFQDQNQSEPDRDNIIAISNENQLHRPNIILIQQSENQPNIIIENTPLSRITEHQSQYTISVQPSLQDSPSKSNKKIVMIKSNHSKHSLFDSKYPQSDFKHSSSDSKTIQLKSSSQQDQQDAKNNKQCKEGMSLTSFLPENELILKKLSDKLQNTEQYQNLFEQSLEYKRILYMLDSEYGISDFKNRTTSPMHPQSSSFPLNQSSSQKSLSLYYLKNSTDLSAKSFNKQIFDSNQENQNNHLHRTNHLCLMDNLDSLFNNHSTIHVKSPQRLTFDLSNQHESLKSSSRFKKHQRSKTSLVSSNQGFNNTKKYHLNLFQQLSHQINEESEQNAYDVNKYAHLKTQNQDDSVYHKVSRNSYLTSSSPNSKIVTSSQSQLEAGISLLKKENLIVKKNKEKNDKNLRFFNQQKTNLIVKKTKKHRIQKGGNLEQAQKLFEENKENFQLKDSRLKVCLAKRKQDRKQQSFGTYKLDIRDQSRCDNFNLKDDLFGVLASFNNEVESKDECELNEQNIDESKVSDACCRPIKYKVYTREQQVGGKQDKRKVLQDIVSILNTKYNKNIQFKQ